MCLTAIRLGLVAGFSYDLTTGTDLATWAGRAEAWSGLQNQQPRLPVGPPPCTSFSVLQAINKNKFSPDVLAARQRLGESLLVFALACCQEQHRHKRSFVLEHPFMATSWQHLCIREVIALPGVGTTDFDHFATGLARPGEG